MDLCALLGKAADCYWQPGARHKVAAASGGACAARTVHSEDRKEWYFLLLCVCVDDVKGLILFWAEMDLQIQLFELVGEKGVELIPDIIQNRRALLVAQKSAAADEPSVGVFVSMPVGCTLCHLDSSIDSQLAEETYRRPGDHHVGGGPPRGEDEAQGEEGTQDGPDYLPADATGEGKGQSIVRSRSLHFDNYSFMIVCLIIDFNAGYAGFRREGAA
jgi:hypothetical protein